ncbi:MAG: hypothetical protein EAZ07_06005 [Cytophagales bacterium]|nr:MAG: hypothetical protein EAZ07_06005 [Cytophagales bacterium]
MKSTLKYFQKRITNLSANNKSLLALKTYANDIDLHLFDYVNHAKSFHIIEQLVQSKKAIKLCQQIDSRNEQNNILSKKLNKLQRHATLIYEEQGSIDMNIAWPFIHGKLSNGQLIRCPLLLFPVALKLENNEWTIAPKKDTEISINRSFLMLYKMNYNTNFDDSYFDNLLAEPPKDITLFLTALYELLKINNLQINFNQELFQLKLQNFKNYVSKEFENVTSLGQLKLVSESILGLYPQAGNFISHDYDFMIKDSENYSLEDFFYQKSKQLQEPNTTIEKNYCPLPIDAWQEEALWASKTGKSIVIQGPPGSGKSQFITNLVCEFIACGKNVVVVSQKKTALEVIYKKLESIGIENFACLVNDFKNDKRKIFQQLNEQIESIETFKNENNSLNSIHLEKRFIELHKIIQENCNQLKSFKKALFDESNYGKSIKSLYLNTTFNNTQADFSNVFRFFNYEQLLESINKFKRYFSLKSLIEPYSEPLSQRKNFAHLSINDLSDIIKITNNFHQEIEQINQSLQKNGIKELEYQTIKEYFNNEKLIIYFLEFTKTPIQFELLKKYYKQQPSLEWINGISDKINQVLSICPIRFEKIDLQEAQEKLALVELAIKKNKPSLNNFYWNLCSKDKKLIKKYLSEKKLDYTKSTLEQEQAHLSQCINKKNLINEYITQLGITNEGTTEDYIKSYLIALSQSIQLIDQLKAINIFESISNQDIESIIFSLQHLIELVPLWKSFHTRASKYLSEEQCIQLNNSVDFKNKYLHAIETHFEHIVKHDQLIQELSNQELKAIEILEQNFAKESTENLLKIFANEIQKNWIAFIELQNPVLKIVSNGEIEHIELLLQESILEKQNINEQILKIKIKEKIYQKLEYNRLNNLITFRNLKHQLTKKKNLWSIRQIIAEYSSEINRLCPCWLLSPDAVSAIFPIESKIDLVIFDEASQCFAENGIPAIYRANQIVVAGDKQQLAPNDLYQIKWEDENEENPDMQAHSLLSFCERQLPTISLKGHYRSLYPELIQFSNNYYYNNQLNMLPNFEAFRSPKDAIRFYKTEGIWENGKNLVEAESLVNIALNIIREFSDKSIGIIAFNYHQSILIQELLDEQQNMHKQLYDSIKFVKNIENVQGDECDIILLSIGYAPGKSGKINAHFGSLNLEGGAQRLNVAITRAKEKMIIISSIHPEKLIVENTINEGPKLLKKFLQFVAAYQNSKRLELEKIEFSMPINFMNTNEHIHLIEILSNKKQSTSNYKSNFADALTKEEQDYSLVFTDDSKYYQSGNIKETHVYKLIEAKRKHWKYNKYYSRNYYLNQLEKPIPY